MKALKITPTPDAYDNLWFGKRPNGLVVFPSLVKKGKYFVSLGTHQKWDTAYVDNGIRYFDTQEQALDFLQAAGAI